MEAISSSEMLVSIYWTTRCNIPEASHLHIFSCVCHGHASLSNTFEAEADEDEVYRIKNVVAIAFPASLSTYGTIMLSCYHQSLSKAYKIYMEVRNFTLISPSGD
jgi:hypothetical protein